jgi:hypothetical protein
LPAVQDLDKSDVAFTASPVRIGARSSFGVSAAPEVAALLGVTRQPGDLAGVDRGLAVEVVALGSQ